MADTHDSKSCIARCEGSSPSSGTMSSPEQSPQENFGYVLKDVAHALVSKHNPQYLRRGSEHVVYEVPAHPEIVVKASMESIKVTLQDNMFAFPREKRCA